MKKLCCLLGLLLCFSIFSTSNAKSIKEPNEQVILRDDFNEISEYWHWRTDGTGTYSIKDGVAELTIPTTEALYYSNVEMSDGQYENLPWKYNNLKVRVKIEPTAKGSAGWGFWNHRMELSENQLAWFIYLQDGALYPMSGLWIQCYNGLYHVSLPVTGYDVTEWHEYEVKWMPDVVEFYIDNSLIYKVPCVAPFVNCRADVWIDNAVYFPIDACWSGVYRHITQEVPYTNTLYLDYIEISKEESLSEEEKVPTVKDTLERLLPCVALILPPGTSEEFFFGSLANILILLEDTISSLIGLIIAILPMNIGLLIWRATTILLTTLQKVLLRIL